VTNCQHPAIERVKEASHEEEKDAFDLWWAEKPLDSTLTIPAEIHNAVMELSPEGRQAPFECHHRAPPGQSSLALLNVIGRSAGRRTSFPCGAARTQCGCKPRPDQVSEGRSGFRYFGITFG
jgi:hypothetical protein